MKFISTANKAVFEIIEIDCIMKCRYNVGYCIVMTLCMTYVFLSFIEIEITKVYCVRKLSKMPS